MDELNDQRQQRIKKLDTLRGSGVEPHGSRFAVQDRAADLLSLHGEKAKERLEQEKIAVTLAGRIVGSASIRKSGFRGPAGRRRPNAGLSKEGSLVTVL